MSKNEATAADAARAVRVMLMSDAELCNVGATHSKALQFGRAFSEAQWIAAAREIEAITIENAIETAKRCLPENTVAALCRLRDSVRPNAELSGPRPLAAEGSRSNDVLEGGNGGNNVR